jgi:hypothetical protein
MDEGFGSFDAVVNLGTDYESEHILRQQRA